jgi:hypothetical protein
MPSGYFWEAAHRRIIIKFLILLVGAQGVA